MSTELGQQEVIGIFKFKNTGKTPVTITNIRSDCSCTVPQLSKTTYAPGESGEIKAVFTIGDREGSQRKNITVTTNNPEQQTQYLIFETDIPIIATLQPKLLLWRIGSNPDWKEVRIKTAPENQVTVPEEVDESSYKLTPVKDSPGEYTLLLRPASTKERKQTQFPVTVVLPSKTQRPYEVFILVR